MSLLPSSEIRGGPSGPSPNVICVNSPPSAGTIHRFNGPEIVAEKIIIFSNDQQTASILDLAKVICFSFPVSSS